MPTDLQTVLLWRGANQRPTDNSVYANQFSLGSGIEMDAAGGKFGGGCIHGAGTPSSSAFASAAHHVRQRFGASGDFYVSAWVKPEGVNAANSTQVIIGKAASGSQQFYLAFAPSLDTLFFYHTTTGSSSSGAQITGAVSIVPGTWYHVAASRSGGTVRVFLDGVIVASGTLTGTYNSSTAALTVGGIDVSSFNYVFKGSINDAYMVVGDAYRTANFTPETDYLPLPVINGVRRRLNSKIVPGATRPLAAFKRHTRHALRTQDIYHYGLYRIAGTVKADGSPDIPLKRKVLLLREPSMMPLAATWSDPVTGAYVFNSITNAYRYTVVALDYEHNYRAVIADNIAPEAMP